MHLKEEETEFAEAHRIESIIKKYSNHIPFPIFMDKEHFIPVITSYSIHYTKLYDSEAELIGQPHNIVRHPDMPKIIFKMLWEYLQRGSEIHAYVINCGKDGSYYWA